MRVSLIVAMSHNHVIGKGNAIPWHLPGDLPRFKKITMGHPLIMGRKCHESIGRVLPGRRNIVVTRQPDYRVAGVEVCHSLGQALESCAGEAEVFIIGGGEIYALALSRVDRIFLTLIHREIEGDTHMPPIPYDRFEEVSRERIDGPLKHTYVVLDRSSDG